LENQKTGGKGKTKIAMQGWSTGVREKVVGTLKGKTKTTSRTRGAADPTQ